MYPICHKSLFFITITLYFRATNSFSLVSRSYHSSYNEPSSPQYHEDNTKITSQTKGWKRADVPMELDWGNVWTLGSSGFTDFHLKLKGYFSSSPRANSMTVSACRELTQFRLTRFWWLGAKEIPNEFFCFENFECKIILIWKPDLGWNATFRDDYIGFTRRNPSNEVPNFKLKRYVDTLTVLHTFHGPCSRSIWFNELFWGSDKKEEHEKIKTKENFRSVASMISQIPDGVIGFRSKALPTDVGFL